MSAYAFTFTTIDRRPLPLNEYQGRPILVVNTASECGYTPQYASLQRLWERYRKRGLLVLGVPSNDFGGQEPGTEETIQAFCTARYAISFPLTTKQHVIGADAHPFYRWIAELAGDAGAPRWNFHKYLIDPAGDLAEIWPSPVDPLSHEVITVIEALLQNPGANQAVSP